MKKLLPISFILVFITAVFSQLNSNAQGTHLMCTTTSSTDTSGTIYDSGGPTGEYLVDEDCTLLVSPSCATSITLSFSQFSTESGWDFFHVYDGQTTSDPELLNTSGNTLPSPVTCTSGYMLIVWHSDFTIVDSGFACSWTSVIAPSVAPTAAFAIGNTNPPLNVGAQFTDNSTGGPTSWYWQFGDGDTSHRQNPVHAYASSGTFTVTLIAFTCNESDTITNTITVQAAPQIDVNPSTGFTASVLCGDSATFAMNVDNIGGGDLVYSTEGALIGTIKVLALKYGTDQFQEFPRTIAAINQYFTNYTLTSSGTIDPGVLSGLLVGKNVLLIPEHENGNDSVWLNFGPVIRQFLNNGGSVIFLGSNSSYSSDLFNTGVFTGSYVSNDEFLTLDINLPADPLVAGISGTTFVAPSATYSMNLTNPDLVTVVEYQGNDVVAYRYFGAGKAIFIAFDYFATNNQASQVIANAIQWGGQNALPQWIHLSQTSDTVPGSGTSVVNVTFVASSLPAGTYYANIGISSNDPLTPLVSVPCTLTVSGDPIVAISDTCLSFGQIMQNTTKRDTVTVYNNGCDTLFVSSITSNSANFTVNSNVSYLLPGAYTDVVIAFTSSSVGNYTGTLSIMNNDSNRTVCLSGTTSPAPVLNVISTVSDSILACGATESLTFDISNTGITGGVPLTFSISGYPSWVTVNPTSGTDTVGQSTTITVTYSSGTFSAGSQPANIVIATNDPLYPTKTVGFTMLVDNNPCLSVAVSNNTCTGFSTFTTTAINPPSSYYWDFGDGGTDIVPNPTHGYPYNGNFTATLIGCNAEGQCDTVVQNINAIITGPRATSCYPATVAYCCGIGVTLFQVADPFGFVFDNSTGDALDGYSDYTCTDTATLVTNYPYPLTVNTGFTYVETFKMWIDLNNDGVLDPSAERMYVDSAVLTNHVGTFTIPALPTNVYGQPLRLRIASDYSGNASPEPCLDLQFGQVEDYSIFLSYFNGVGEVGVATAFTVYPNPFSESANIEYNLNKTSNVSVEVYNVVGEKVSSFASEEIQSSGKHTYQFNGQATGIYFVKLTVDNQTAITKLVRM